MKVPWPDHFAADFEETYGRRRDYRHGLDFLWLELTQWCNLECVHCYVSGSPRQPLDRGVALVRWQELLAEALELECRKVQFIGGEPLAVPFLEILWSHASSLGYSFIEVFSNLTQPKSQTFLSLLDKGAFFATSLYGSSPQSHDSVTRRPGSWEATMRSIKAIVDQTGRVRVNIVPVSIADAEVEAVKSLLGSLGVEKVGVSKVAAVGAAREQPGAKEFTEEDLCGACWLGQILVSNNGDVFPCTMARHAPMGNVLTGSLVDVVNTRQLGEFRERIRGRGDCENSEQEPADFT